MQHRKFQTLSIAILVIAGLVLVVRQSRGSVANSTEASLGQLVNTARLINTAEWKYHARKGTFVSWSELCVSSDFADSKGMLEQRGMSFSSPFNPGEEITSGIALKLLVEVNSQYEFRLTDENDKSCRPSVFSDEKGSIFQGIVISCKH